MVESFNLLREPWITVLDVEGNASDVSIIELLQQSREYRSFANELPTADFAILRIILAILYRSWCGSLPKNKGKRLEFWAEKWDQENLYDEEVEAYCTSVHDRFDLRDKVAPFFQVSDLHTSKNEWKPIQLILPDVGEEGDLFSMSVGTTRISPSHAARMLVNTMAWDFSGIKSGAVGDPRVKGGRGYGIGIGWAGWLGATILNGDNLHQTLMLNYAPVGSHSLDSEDLPVWEKPPLTAAPEKLKHHSMNGDPANVPSGQVELLTWQQRRIRLRWDDEGFADAALVCNGDPVGYTVAHGVETMTPWRFSEPQTKKAKVPVFMPRQLIPGRAMWRSLSGILPNAEAPKVKRGIGEGSPLEEPAGTIQWVSELVAHHILPAKQPVRVQMVTMEYGAQSSSYSNILADHLTVSSSLLNQSDETSRAVARRAVELTDEVARIISRFYRQLAEAAGNRDVADGEIGDIMSRFYAALDLDFRGWLSELGTVTDPVAHLNSWNQSLWNVAMALGQELLKAQNPSVWAGVTDGEGTTINASLAHSYFLGRLAKIVGPKNKTNSTSQGGNSE